MQFLNDEILEESAVVANCRMNRERELTGPNGYSYELGLNPFDLLIERVASSPEVHWLDLCCGTGRALIEAAHAVHRNGLEDRIGIVGVDLVGMFAPLLPELKCLRLHVASLSTWKPDRRYDLITCIHGLHYIGDKLGLIARASSWLADDGIFVASLDLNNIRVRDGSSMAGRTAPLRRAGVQYSARKKRIRIDGRRQVSFPFRYLGANDQAGPNYTGQPAVDSYYEPVD